MNFHFFKLVAWCYVFVFEASQPAGKYISTLLRVAKPEEHGTVSATFEMVNHLRTVRVHNLSVQSGRDDYKRRQAHIWLVQNGGDPRDWSACCRSLGYQVTVAIRCLMDRWHQVTASEEDAVAVVKDLMIAVDREWPPHLFDRIVEDAARDIGLGGLDSAKYRESRLDRWRELTNCFESREHAEAAISVAIRRELERLFGNQATARST